VRPTHLVVSLEAETDVEHRLDFLLVEVAQGDEVAPFEISRDHFCLSFVILPNLCAVASGPMRSREPVTW
jgi:hypothetical protein